MRRETHRPRGNVPGRDICFVATFLLRRVDQLSAIGSAPAHITMVP
jgi:hypothetical protein